MEEHNEMKTSTSTRNTTSAAIAPTKRDSDDVG
jgi:hypothetical protein